MLQLRPARCRMRYIQCMHHNMRMYVQICLRRRPEDEGIVVGNTFSSQSNCVVVTYMRNMIIMMMITRTMCMMMMMMLTSMEYGNEQWAMSDCKCFKIIGIIIIIIVMIGMRMRMMITMRMMRVQWRRCKLQPEATLSLPKRPPLTAPHYCPLTAPLLLYKTPPLAPQYYHQDALYLHPRIAAVQDSS